MMIPRRFDPNTGTSFPTGRPYMPGTINTLPRPAGPVIGPPRRRPIRPDFGDDGIGGGHGGLRGMKRRIQPRML